MPGLFSCYWVVWGVIFPSKLWCLNTFSWSLNFSLYSDDWSFASHRCFWFIIIPFTSFPLYFSDLTQEDLIHTSVRKITTLCFLLVVFTVSDIMFKSLIIFFKSTLVLRLRQRSTVILACGCAFPPNSISWWNCSFPACSWHSCRKPVKYSSCFQSSLKVPSFALQDNEVTQKILNQSWRLENMPFLWPWIDLACVNSRILCWCSVWILRLGYKRDHSLILLGSSAARIWGHFYTPVLCLTWALKSVDNSPHQFASYICELSWKWIQVQY